MEGLYTRLSLVMRRRKARLLHVSERLDSGAAAATERGRGLACRHERR